jgi:hypothetical protein
LIIRAGTKVECSQGHVCGEVTTGIDTDQRIVVPDGDRPPFESDVGGGACIAGSQEWRCAGCDAGNGADRIYARGAAIPRSTSRHVHHARSSAGDGGKAGNTALAHLIHCMAGIRWRAWYKRLESLRDWVLTPLSSSHPTPEHNTKNQPTPNLELLDGSRALAFDTGAWAAFQRAGEDSAARNQRRRRRVLRHNHDGQLHAQPLSAEGLAGDSLAPTRLSHFAPPAHPLAGLRDRGR